MVVLQPTSRCNLDCRYCYIADRADSTVMSEHTLRAALATVFSSAVVHDQIELLWHAGEPLSAGLPFYRRAFELIDEHNTGQMHVQQAMQTNATLMTPALAELLGSNGVNVGVSLDGPSHLHDSQRQTRSGRGSHAATVRGLRLLQATGAAVGALCVITRRSLGYADEIYDEFVRLGIRSVGFNVEEIEGVNQRSSLLREHEAACRLFFERLWNRWSADPTLLEIREFDRTLTALNEARTDTGWQREPDDSVGFRIVTITKTGDVFTYSPELAGVPALCLGNVHRHSLDWLTSSQKYLSQKASVEAGKDLCAKTCGYFRLCGSGYTSNKYFEHGTLATAETTTCRLHRQALLEVIFAQLEQRGGSIHLHA